MGGTTSADASNPYCSVPTHWTDGEVSKSDSASFACRRQRAFPLCTAGSSRDEPWGGEIDESVGALLRGQL